VVVNEGERTKISSINFVGNSAYSDGRLAAVLQTKESGILSFLTRKDVYNEDKLRADEEALRQFYYNHGYADFRVISSEAVPSSFMRPRRRQPCRPSAISVCMSASFF